MARLVPARRWAFAAAIGVALGAAALGVYLALTPADDGDVVYCLDHEPDLVRAGIALKQGAAGSDQLRIRIGGDNLTVEQWRAARPDDFRRTCAALRAAAGSGGRSPNTNFLLTAGTTLLSAALGAGFTWLVTSGRDRTARRRQEAQDLQVAVQAFRTSVVLYLLGWRDRSPRPPAADGVVGRLVDLESHLRRLHLIRPTWDKPKDLLDQLKKSPFGSDLVDHEKWSSLPVDNRPAAADAITVRLDKLTEDAESVAYQHERSGRRADVKAGTG